MLVFLRYPRSTAHCTSRRISAEMNTILPPQYIIQNRFIYSFLYSATRGAAHRFLTLSGSHEQARKHLT
jgi:hypothetical protein